MALRAAVPALSAASTDDPPSNGLPLPPSQSRQQPHPGSSQSKGCCLCCVPDIALKHIGPAQPLEKKGAGEGDRAAAAPAGVVTHGHGANAHTHKSMGEAVRCVSQCAVRCIHDHMPGHQPRAPPKMREEEAKKWLIAKRKDFARYR